MTTAAVARTTVAMEVAQRTAERGSVGHVSIEPTPAVCGKVETVPSEAVPVTPAVPSSVVGAWGTGCVVVGAVVVVVGACETGASVVPPAVVAGVGVTAVVAVVVVVVVDVVVVAAGV